MVSNYQAAKKSGFVSGHRFSDAERLAKSDAPLGAGHRKSTLPQRANSSLGLSA
jgi:hypothetical protein